MTNTEVSIVSVQDGPLRGAFHGSAVLLSVRGIERKVWPLVEFAPGVTRAQKVGLSYDILGTIVDAVRAHAVNPLIDVDETAYRDSLRLLNRLIPSTWDGPSGEYTGSSGLPYSSQLV